MTVSEILEVASELKGEMVVVVEGNRDDYEKDVDYGQLLHMVNESIEQGMTTSDAIKETAKKTGVSKNIIYDLFHNKERKENIC